MEKNTPKAFEKYTDCRTFILMSTLMTWAKTKPIDPVSKHDCNGEIKIKSIFSYRKIRTWPSQKRISENGNHIRIIKFTVNLKKKLLKWERGYVKKLILLCIFFFFLPNRFFFQFPKNLRTIVIGSGITYGHEEDVLHFLFKMAWQNAHHLPLFTPGKNLLPMIHVDSLASVVHLIMEEFPRRYKYIIACEQIPTKLKDIVKVSKFTLSAHRFIKFKK